MPASMRITSPAQRMILPFPPDPLARMQTLSDIVGAPPARPPLQQPAIASLSPGRRCARGELGDFFAKLAFSEIKAGTGWSDEPDSIVRFCPMELRAIVVRDRPEEPRKTDGWATAIRA